MAAELTGEQGARFLELGLHVRVAGAPHDGSATVLADHVVQVPRALHVVDDVGSRIAADDVLSEQHEQLVRPDDLAGRCNHAKAVTVAVEGETDIGLLVLHHVDQVPQVLGLCRVRVVIGEVAVDVAVQRHDLAAELLEQSRRQLTGHTIAAVHDNLAGLGHHHALQYPVQVMVVQVHLLDLTLAVRQLVIVQTSLQALDALFGQRLAGDHHLQAVVVRRVVAAGDHDAGAGIQRVGGEVEKRRRHLADVDHVAAAFVQAPGQRIAQRC